MIATTRPSVPPTSSTPRTITNSLRARIVGGLCALTTRDWVDGKATASMAATLHSVTSAAGDAGERLDRVLAAHLGNLSRSRLKHLILEGNVTRDGATISDPAMRVKPGQTFHVAIPEAV